MGELERGPRVELQVQVDIAAGASTAGAELVVAGDLRVVGALGGDRALDLVELGGRRRLVDEHPAGATRMLKPV